MAGLQSLQQPEMDEGEDGGGETPNVTPEEQAAYEQAVRNALKLIYPEGEGEPVTPDVLNALKASDNPMMNLATAAVTIITTLRESAKSAGKPIDPEILFHVGRAVIEELAELADAAKIHDFSEKELEQSFYQALDMYRDSAAQSGDLDQTEMKAGFEQVIQADRAGQLDQLLPGIGSRMKGE